jgi:hypothetical protein
MPSPTSVPEFLRQAANRIRQGWCQYALADDAGGVCAVGALNWVQNGSGDLCLITDEWMGAHEQLTRTLKSDNIVQWNNAPDQTAENVAQAFEFAALLYEQEHAPKDAAETEVAVNQ